MRSVPSSLARAVVDALSVDDDQWVERRARSHRFLRARIAGIVVLAVIVALLPGAGDQRLWVSGTLLVVIAPLDLLAERRAPARAVDPLHTLVDITAVVVLVHFIPSAWVACLVVGVTSLALGAHLLGRAALLGLATVLTGGMALAGIVHSVPNWAVPVIAIASMVPAVLAYTTWQRRRQRLAWNRVGVLVESVAAILWEYDRPSSSFVTVHGQVARLTGLEPATFRSSWSERIHPDDHDRVSEALDRGPGPDLVLRLRHATDRRWVSLKMVGQHRVDHGTDRVTGVAFDITELEATKQALDARTRSDSLTGLPNRDGLVGHLEERLDHQRAEVAFLMLDIDRFKDVNDTLGHPMGDQLIRVVAARLSSVAGDTVHVGRLSGDEFGIVVSHAEPATHAHQVAMDIVEALGRPVTIDDLELSVSVSIGIAVAGGTSDATDLLRDADIAMYQAKRNNTTVEVFSERPAQLTRDRLGLQAEVARDLDGAIHLHYQPVVDLDTGRIVAVEGLARWAHPDRGLLAPADFLDVVDRAGLTDEFERRVLDLAVGQAARHVGGDDLAIAVNLSARFLRSPRLLPTIGRLLESHLVPAELLTVEISEQDIDEDLAAVLPVLADLRELGLGIALDDFGTGHSSLIRLRELPFTQIKIDRRFVVDMTEDRTDMAIVRSTIDLAGQLGLTTVAEGVETPEVADALRDLGCDRAQGFLYAPAVPEQQLHRIVPGVGTCATRTGLAPTRTAEPADRGARGR